MKSQFLDAWRRLAGQGVYPHEFAWMLLLPIRNLVLSPEKLIKRMGINEKSIVLEIGPGPGFYSIKVAQKVSAGRLYITDIQPEMLEIVRRRMYKRQITNVDFKIGDGVNLPYEDQIFDLVFLVTVLGEVANQDQYLKEIYRILRPEAILSISENFGDSDNLTLSATENLLKKNGFELVKAYGKGRTFTANFKKKS